MRRRWSRRLAVVPVLALLAPLVASCQDDADPAPASLDEFVAGASEHKGSWWPDWISWLTKQAPKTLKADGARVPGAGKRKAIEDAPGRYVRTR